MSDGVGRKMRKAASDRMPLECSFHRRNRLTVPDHWSGRIPVLQPICKVVGQLDSRSVFFCLSPSGRIEIDDTENPIDLPIGSKISDGLRSSPEIECEDY